MAKSYGPLDIIASMGKTELAKAEALSSVAAIKSHATKGFSDSIRDITVSDTTHDIKKLGISAQIELAKLTAKF